MPDPDWSFSKTLLYLSKKKKTGSKLKTCIVIISVTSANMGSKTIKQNEGLKCTANLWLMDPHAPWMIVFDSGEHYYTLSVSILQHKEQGKGWAVWEWERRKVIGSCFNALCSSAF